MTGNGSFLRQDSKSWVSSNLFFMSLAQLSVNVDKYYMPIGFECDNEQLKYYVEALLDEVATLEFKDCSLESFKAHREYIRKICFILRAWSREGHGLRVV